MPIAAAASRPAVQSNTFLAHRRGSGVCALSHGRGRAAGLKTLSILCGAPHRAHVRRKFFDEYKRSSSAPCGSAPLKSNGSPIAKEALAKIGELFEIERAIAGKPPAQRQPARMEKAKPKLDALAVWMDTQLQLISG